MILNTKPRLAMGLSLLIFIISFTYLLAQGNSLFVTITRFEPQVNGDTVAYVTVVDENGLPVAGLTKDDFSILEDDQLNLSDKVKVESTNDTELRLVLALDVSMPPPEVATMKEAAIRYIQSLQAKDQVALFVFFDETKLVQDFTEDKAKVVSLVQGLQPEGDFTTLHETVFNATTKASQFPVGRRAVIVVTNSGNNINAPYTADETIKHAQELQVPLYVIALQTLNRLTEFQDVAQLTGGQSYILKDAGAVAESLSDIDKRLRPAYKVTYPSQIAPDNQEHAVSFGVKYKGATGTSAANAPASTGTSQTKFVAVLDKIDVKIIGVNEGQTVTGLVNLMAEVTAPNKGVKVQYCLDNKVLGEATEPPYIFEWNTNQSQPGSSILCAKAIDAAGHIGEAKLKVRVPVPIAVTIATDPRQQASLGQPITVEAKVVALSDVAKVDFLVNGDTIGSDTNAPYQFTWKGTQTGTFTLTARAEDVLGGKNEDNTSIKLLAVAVSPTEPILGWWQRFLKWIRAPYSLIGWIACMTLLFLLLLIPFMLLLARYLRNKGRRLAHVELTNLGNIISRYELRADDPDNALIFQFSLNKKNLLQRQVMAGNSGITPIYTTGLPVGARPVAGPPMAGTSYVAGQSQVGVGVAPNANPTGAPSASADPSAGDAGVSTGSTQDKVKQLTALGRMGGIFGEILFAVSYILPAFLAAPMRSVAQTLRRADMASQRVDRGVKQLDKLQGQAPMGGGAPTANRPPAPAATAPAQGSGISNPLSGSQDKIKQVTALGRMGGVIGEVLFAVSYILPAFLASPMRSVAQTLRRADMASQRVDRGVKQLDKMQGQATTSTQAMGQAASSVGLTSAETEPAANSNTPVATNTATGTPLTPSATTIQTPYARFAIPPTAQAAGPHTLADDVVIESWAESPYIAPGEALTVDLWIQAFRPYRTKRYPFIITSRSVEQEGAPVVVERGDIMLYNVLALHRIFWPIAIYVTVLLSAMVSVTLALLVVGILS